MNRTFKKGIHPPSYKTGNDEPLSFMPAPSTVYIPLSQHIGKPAKLCVAVGDKVKIGTLLAVADGLGAPVHSSVSGVVRSTIKMPLPNGSQCEHVVIENDGANEKQLLAPIDTSDNNAVLRRIDEAGIVGMGGAGFPSAVKYRAKNVEYIIVNAAECEPYITCDYRMLLERSGDILDGCRIVKQLSGAKKVFIAVEDNKQAAINHLNNLLRSGRGNDVDNDGIKDIEIVPLRTKYPQGAEKQLIYAVTGRKVPLGKLPADVGAIVNNVCTVHAIHRAVVCNEPLTARPLTVTGGAMNRIRNLFVPIGTLFEDIVNYAGGVKEEAVKLICGGPMMGNALNDLHYASSKTVNCILALDEKEANIDAPQACINCATCAQNCPMNLMPMYIDAYALAGDYENAKKYGATSCMECGCCTYNCPAKRPIVQSIRLAKRKIKELKI